MKIGIDIGGTLIKICIKDKNFIFKQFDTSDFNLFYEYLKLLISDYEIKKIGITGGGSYKFKKKLNFLNVKFIKYDEFYALVNGVCRTYSNKNDYLIINIGSGVSFLKVSNNYFERVGGTNIGGGTFLSLIKYMTNYNSFDSIIDLYKKGNNENVDMLVNDIYGGNYHKLNKNLVASSFNSIFSKKNNDCDIINSVLKMICFNIAHLSYLYAKQFNINEILFSGSFVSKKEIQKLLNFGINHWANNKIKCIFLENIGYMGAYGCII
jgi:type II pantothenate kinase